MGAAAKAVHSPRRLSDKQKTSLLSKKPHDRFKAGGYSVAPIEIFTYANRFREGGAQILAVQWIMYEQFKRVKVPEWVKVSTRGLARMTQGAYTAKSFDLALEDAADRGLVEREKRGREWWYRCFPEDWAAIDPIEKTPPQLVLMPAPEADAPEADAPEALIVPGRSSQSRIISMKIAVPGVGDPMDLDVNFRVRNDLGVPFSCKPRFDGKTFWAVVSAPKTEGETKANDCEVGFHIAEKPISKNQRLTEIGQIVGDLLKSEFGKALTPDDKPFVARIAEALGTAPPSRLSAYAIAEIATMRRKKKHVATGILEFFAGKVKAIWDAEAGERAAAVAKDAGLISRLVDHYKCSEHEARERIARWREAGWNPEYEITRLEHQAVQS